MAAILSRLQCVDNPAHYSAAIGWSWHRSIADNVTNALHDATIVTFLMLTQKVISNLSVLHSFKMIGLLYGCSWARVSISRGVKIHRVGRYIVIQSSRYISWYRKRYRNTYRFCIIYSIILKLLLEYFRWLKNSIYYMYRDMDRIVRHVSRYVSYRDHGVSLHPYP